MVTIGSLSKVFWGGLRVGWIRAPQLVLSHLGRLKAILDLGSSLPSQVLAVLLLQRADEIVPIRMEEIRSRAVLLGSLVSTRLPGWSFAEPAGGLVLWTKLPHGSASEFAEVARANGTLILPGPMTSPSGWFDDHARLPYVAKPEVLEQGVHRRSAHLHLACPRRAAERGGTRRGCGDSRRACACCGPAAHRALGSQAAPGSHP